MKCSTLVLSLALFLVCLAAPVDAADRNKQSAAPANAKAAATDKQVMAFVEKHHAELAMLLGRLKRDSVTEYRRAIGDIREVHERVERLAERQPARAEYEVDRWKSDSRIRLLTARMVSLMEASTEGVEHPDLAAARDELRDLSRQRVQLERDRLEREKKALLDRLDKLQEQTARIDGDFEAAVNRQMSVLSRGVDLAAKKRGVAPKPAKKRPEATQSPRRKPTKSEDDTAASSGKEKSRNKTSPKNVD